ncbi:MAG: hypothetical protein M1828_003843 [Chrysothrix sp. TS-e1954]|nr:MAG: hypothetical protein M1828_003843 [Chrysothrix sp. TS-e1954]
MSKSEGILPIEQSSVTSSNADETLIANSRNFSQQTPSETATVLKWRQIEKKWVIEKHGQSTDFNELNFPQFFNKATGSMRHPSVLIKAQRVSSNGTSRQSQPVSLREDQSATLNSVPHTHPLGPAPRDQLALENHYRLGSGRSGQPGTSDENGMYGGPHEFKVIQSNLVNNPSAMFSEPTTHPRSEASAGPCVRSTLGYTTRIASGEAGLAVDSNDLVRGDDAASTNSDPRHYGPWNDAMHEVPPEAPVVSLTTPIEGTASNDSLQYPDEPLTTGQEPNFKIGYWRGDRMITAGNNWSHPANAEILRRGFVQVTLHQILPLLENPQLTEHVLAQLAILREVCEERDALNQLVTRKKPEEINKSTIWPKLLRDGLVRETDTAQEKRARDVGLPYSKPTRAEIHGRPVLEPTFDYRGYMARTNLLRLVPLDRLRWPGGGISAVVWQQLTAKDACFPVGERVYHVDLGFNGPLAMGLDLMADYLKTQQSERRMTKRRRGTATTLSIQEITHDT